MKTVAKSASSQIVVFGLDAAGKPQAGRFAPQEAETARQAAASLNLTACDVSADLTELAKEVPMGRIHARGRGLLPYVKRDLYDRLQAAADNSPISAAKPKSSTDGTPVEQSLAAAKAVIASALPTDWDSIAPGHLVLVQESLADGWWEAIVIARENESLTLRYRDFPHFPTYRRHFRSVALIHRGLA